MEKTPDETIRENVLKILTINHQTKESTIDVAATGGKIHLRGIVESSDIKRSAEQIAAAVPGVALVINELEIRAGRPADGPDVIIAPPGERTV